MCTVSHRRPVARGPEARSDAVRSFHGCSTALKQTGPTYSLDPGSLSSQLKSTCHHGARRYPTWGYLREFDFGHLQAGTIYGPFWKPPALLIIETPPCHRRNRHTRPTFSAAPGTVRRALVHRGRRSTEGIPGQAKRASPTRYLEARFSVSQFLRGRQDRKHCQQATAQGSTRCVSLARSWVESLVH